MANLDPAAIPSTLAVVNTLAEPLMCGAARVPLGSSTVQLGGLAMPVRIQTWNALVRFTARGYVTSSALQYALEQPSYQAFCGGHLPSNGQAGRGGHTLRGGHDAGDVPPTYSASATYGRVVTSDGSRVVYSDGLYADMLLG